jgi:hypothetical protein
MSVYVLSLLENVVIFKVLAFQFYTCIQMFQPCLGWKSFYKIPFSPVIAVL